MSVPKAMGASISLLALVASIQWTCPTLLCRVSPGLLNERGIVRALVDGHNDLSLDGCEGDSGKGVKLGISLRVAGRNTLGEVIDDPVGTLLLH